MKTILTLTLLFFSASIMLAPPVSNPNTSGSTVMINPAGVTGVDQFISGDKLIVTVIYTARHTGGGTLDYSNVGAVGDIALNNGDTFTAESQGPMTVNQIVDTPRVPFRLKAATYHQFYDANPPPAGCLPSGSDGIYGGSGTSPASTTATLETGFHFDAQGTLTTTAAGVNRVNLADNTADAFRMGIDGVCGMIIVGTQDCLETVRLQTHFNSPNGNVFIGSAGIDSSICVTAGADILVSAGNKTCSAGRTLTLIGQGEVDVQTFGNVHFRLKGTCSFMEVLNTSSTQIMQLTQVGSLQFDNSLTVGSPTVGAWTDVAGKINASEYYDDGVLLDFSAGGETVTILTSGVIDLTVTTFVDVTIPAGTIFYPRSFMAIGVTNVDIDGDLDVGTIADTELYFSNRTIIGGDFNDNLDAELFVDPEAHRGIDGDTGLNIIRITPNGVPSTGSVIVKLIGLSNPS